jgi:Cell wall-active antibiotics response LiaF, C-terminal
MTIVDRPTETVSPGPTRPRGWRPLTRAVIGAVLIVIGALWLIERTGVADLSVTAVLALGTALTGVALMVLARNGAHGGLVVFGTVLGVVTLVTAAAPMEGFQGGVGDRTIDIRSVTDIQPDYDLSMGKLTIDLRAMDDFDSAARLSASVGMGELVIRVPSDISVMVEARVGAGQIELMGKQIDGVGIEQSYRTPGLEESEPGLELDLSVFTGRVEVTNE